MPRVLPGAVTGKDSRPSYSACRDETPQEPAHECGLLWSNSTFITEMEVCCSYRSFWRSVPMDRALRPRKCLTATSAAAVRTPTVTLPPAGRGQNNSQLCALPPTDAGLQLALEPSPMEQLSAPIRASNGQSKISYTDQEVQLMLGL